MSIVVVGGSGRGVGKTALVCGLIAALPEVRWTAVKITGHAHGKTERIWEETEPGQGSDTARYLTAGAGRALLVTANDEEIEAALKELLAGRDEMGPGMESGANYIFESNRVLRFLAPDICLAVREAGRAERAEAGIKPSFAGVLKRADAVVTRVVARRESAENPAAIPAPEAPEFHLAQLDRIPAAMAAWLRARLAG